MNSKLEQVPDTDLKLEKRTLSAMLADPQALRVANEMLTGGMFYHWQNQTIFDCLSVAFCRGQVLDEILLAKALEDRGTARDDARYLAGEIVMAGGMPGCIEEYCVALADLNQRREMQRLAGDMAVGNTTSAEALQRLQALKPPDESIKAASNEVLSAEIESEIAGHRYAVHIPPWPVWSSTQFLAPGSVGLLCGTEGVSKSFMAVELLRAIFTSVKCCGLMLESGAEFHLRRALVQEAGRSELMSLDWVRNNAAEARQILHEHKAFREAFKACIESPAVHQRIDCDFLVRWLRVKCMAGHRVLLIDPVSIMQGSDRRFLDHERFVVEAKAIMREYGASLLCITHPRAGMPGAVIVPSLENIPNGTSWRRFGDFVFWLHRPRGKKDAMFDDGQIHDYNRELHCLKVRMAINPGVIAYYLDGKTMHHNEWGVLVDEPEPEPAPIPKKYKDWPWSKKKDAPAEGGLFPPI